MIHSWWCRGNRSMFIVRTWPPAVSTSTPCLPRTSRKSHKTRLAVLRLFFKLKFRAVEYAAQRLIAVGTSRLDDQEGQIRVAWTVDMLNKMLWIGSRVAAP